MAMLQVPNQRHIVCRQIDGFKLFVASHRVAKIINMDKQAMKSILALLCWLTNVVHVTSTPSTNRTGIWNVLVRNRIPQTELIAMDTIIKERSVTTATFKFDAFRRQDVRD